MVSMQKREGRSRGRSKEKKAPTWEGPSHAWCSLGGSPRTFCSSTWHWPLGHLEGRAEEGQWGHIYHLLLDFHFIHWYYFYQPSSILTWLSKAAVCNLPLSGFSDLKLKPTGNMPLPLCVCVCACVRARSRTHAQECGAKGESVWGCDQDIADRRKWFLPCPAVKQ